MVSTAYGLSFGCSGAPIEHRIGSWIQSSRRRHGVEPNGSVPLWKRRGVACLAPDQRVGHVGLNGCAPWETHRARDKGVQRASLNENSDAICAQILESTTKEENDKMAIVA